MFILTLICVKIKTNNSLSYSYMIACYQLIIKIWVVWITILANKWPWMQNINALFVGPLFTCSALNPLFIWSTVWVGCNTNKAIRFRWVIIRWQIHFHILLLCFFVVSNTRSPLSLFDRLFGFRPTPFLLFHCVLLYCSLLWWIS